jgi:DNA polymerase-3 subunit epsilon
MVKDAPAFKEVWAKVSPLLDGAHYFAAHNAGFDRGVLNACCLASGLAAPPLPFVCTVQIARRVWQMKPANLPAVCRRLGIGLIHHDAGSDAEACARIIIAATARPALPPPPPPPPSGSRQLTLPGFEE